MRPIALFLGLALLLALGCGRNGPPEPPGVKPIPEYLFPGDLGYQPLPEQEVPEDEQDALQTIAPSDPNQQF